ncbi:Guanylate cyclase 2G [Thoreauomyces humboldtii]|nr:Guanylate cyclase 2G [Thoreauomyces humboldtii]
MSLEVDGFVPSLSIFEDSAVASNNTEGLDSVGGRLAIALRRCRAIKEQKLAAQRRWGNFVEEEVTVFEANIKEARQLYEQQLEEQRLVDDRQREAAADLLAAEARKGELIGMVSKIAAVKRHLNAQDEAREREVDFRAKQKQKRSAFEKRSKVIEAAQVAEREDLVVTQERVSRNLKAIHSLELRGMTESHRRAHNRDFQLRYQQLRMRQQKEAEQLREVQLLKLRHMAEQMEVELLTGAEIDDLTTEHRARENRMLADQVIERANEAAKLERQQAQLMALQLKEEQKVAKGSLLHHQVRQRKVLERNQKSSVRQRERAIADETGNMLLEIGQTMIGLEEGSAPAMSDRDTSEMPTSEGDISEFTDGSLPGGLEDPDLRRRARSKNDAAQELTEAMAKGMQRARALEASQKKLFDSMRSQHKDQMSQKLRELKRKQSQLLKDQEDEVMTIRREQVADMDELFDLIRQAQELHTEQEEAKTRAKGGFQEGAHSNNVMPASFVESIKSGFTPTPVTYDHATVIRTGVAGMEALSAKQVLPLVQRLAQTFDEVMQSYPDVCRVESTGAEYVLCAGLNSDGQPDSEDTAESLIDKDVATALDCARMLQDRVAKMDVRDLNLPLEKLALNIGVEHGLVKAGLLGTRLPHFRILGETVDRAAQICAAAEHPGILVSDVVREFAGDKYLFEQVTSKSGQFWLTGAA